MAAESQSAELRRGGADFSGEGLPTAIAAELEIPVQAECNKRKPATPKPNARIGYSKPVRGLEPGG